MAPYSTLTLRLMWSALLIPLVIGILAVGGWIFGITMAVCIGIAVSEWVVLSQKSTQKLLYKIVLILLGILYLGFSYYEIISLRLLFANGFILTLGLLLTVWASDSGAYLFGKKIGGPKLTPTISPNKTWAGLLGSVLCASATLVLWSHFFIPEAPIFLTLSFGAAMGVIGQSGDLLISYFKRKANVKDTGHLIPGHGGILDRIDALLLVLPVYTAFAKIVLLP